MKKGIYKTSDDINNDISNNISNNINNKTYKYYKIFSPVKVAFASVILLLITLGTLSFIFSPISYIKICSNTTKSIIELNLNKFDRVIGIAILDNNGEAILNETIMNIKGKKYLEALEIIINDKNFKEWFSKNSDFTLTVLSKDSNKTFKIHHLISNYTKENDIYEEHQYGSNGQGHQNGSNGQCKSQSNN